MAANITTKLIKIMFFLNYLRYDYVAIYSYIYGHCQRLYLPMQETNT